MNFHYRTIYEKFSFKKRGLHMFTPVRTGVNFPDFVTVYRDFNVRILINFALITESFLKFVFYLTQNTRNFLSVTCEIFFESL